MPLTRREVFQLGLLLLCVPAQYYLTGIYQDDTSPELRQQTILNVLSEFRQLKDSWFSVQAWKAKYMELVVWIVRDIMNIAEDNNESVAVEVLQYREKLRGKTLDIRVYRPKSVLYRVGQVVGNLKMGYKGVVVGWKINPEINDNVPTYNLLVDEGDSDKPQESVEISQDDLYLIDHSMVKNRYIRHYFYTFDGTQYVPQQWLREKYPKD